MNRPAPFTRRQRAYLERCMTSWFNVAEGGKRAGKNVLQTAAFCICLDDHPDKIHLVAGVSATTARLNVLDCGGFGLLNYFEGRCRSGLYQGRSCLYIDSRRGEKVVLVSGGGRCGDEKLIKGNTYGMACVTEANECAPAFLHEVFDRTLSSGARRVFHDLNPKAEGHWYYTGVLAHHVARQAENPRYGYNYGHFTIADNLSVSEGEMRERMATYDARSVWFQRDILGRRRQAEGLVYPMFDAAVHVVPTIERPYEEYQMSVDYGTQNPFSAGLWGLCGGVWYRVREFYHSGRDTRRQLTDEEYHDALERLAGNAVVRRVIVDPSAASFIALMRRKGRFVPRRADNAVLPGIANVASALRRGRLKFNDCCRDVIREFGLYAWEAGGGTGRGGEDRPAKVDDHAMDEVRYFVRTSAYHPA